MTRPEFIAAYAPMRGYARALNEQEAHGGDYHTIRQALVEYGTVAVCKVVDDMLKDFQAFACPKAPFTVEQRRQLCFTIIATCKTMKCSELQLFFVKAKAGHFGKFYNVIEPLDITTKLATWSQECTTKRNEAAAAAWEEFQRQQRDHTIDYDTEFSETVRHFSEDGQIRFIFKDK